MKWEEKAERGEGASALMLLRDLNKIILSKIVEKNKRRRSQIYRKGWRSILKHAEIFFREWRGSKQKRE